MPAPVPGSLTISGTSCRWRPYRQVKGFRNLTLEDVVRLFEEPRSVTMRHVDNADGLKSRKPPRRSIRTGNSVNRSI